MWKAILLGMASPILETFCFSKLAKFPFWTMDYSPLWSKNLIKENWLKKIMQVEVDLTYMHTNFGGHSLLGFSIGSCRVGYLRGIARLKISETGSASLIIQPFNNYFSFSYHIHLIASLLLATPKCQTAN